MSRTTLARSLSERVEALRSANVNGPAPGRLTPPAPRAAWHRRDRLGLALQLGAASVVLLVRLALFVYLAPMIRHAAPPLTRADALPALFGLDLASAAQGAGLGAAGWLAVALAWVCL